MFGKKQKKQREKNTVNLCLSCAKYNVNCSYGHDTTCISCTDWQWNQGIITNANYRTDKFKLARTVCPNCQSKNISNVLIGKRSQCKDCGNVFS